MIGALSENAAVVDPRSVTLRGRHLVVIDILATVGAFILSFALRFDAPSSEFGSWLVRFAWVLAILLPVRLACLFALGMYQRVWRYASVEELQGIVAAIGLSSALAYAFVYAVSMVLPGDEDMVPRSIPVIETLLAVTLIGFSRFSLRIARVGRRAGARLAGAERTLIVGAGSAGASIANQLRADRTIGLSPVGFVDDDLPLGQRIFGIPVVARTSDLELAIEKHGAGTVLIAMPAAEGKQMRRLVRQCERLKVRALTVPSIAEVIGGRVTATTVRKIQVEDLLRRSPARIEMDEVRRQIADETVLITGAGGSIGSELARQIMAFGPRHIHLLGKGENSIFDIDQELKASGIVSPVILDVRDTERLAAFVRHTRPGLVFHAAAHKHVHLMERYPDEAVATNILGTANLLRACERAAVPRFVLISTDKAVKPTSVMGATKRVAELLVRESALRTGFDYVAVRFGNVLSSRGSVVPLFRRQLERGGPLTVTDPDVTRYFMTIPEAVQLVLQAAVLGQGGEIFVLDMGEPVKIVDLASQLAELHDLELGVDVGLEFTGLRPGEKMHEELFLDDEVPERTRHENIFVARSASPVADVMQRADALRQVVQRGTAADVGRLLAELVPEYIPAQSERLPGSF